ncbi:MAG: ATP-binding protein, partial [Candidatus Competibacterales bacterium]
MLHDRGHELPYQAFIDCIATAAAVDRGYVFLNHTDARQRLWAHLHAEYCTPGVASIVDNPALCTFLYQHWHPCCDATPLMRGEVLRCQRADLQDHSQAPLQAQDTQALLLAPLNVAGAFFGFVAFDDCRGRGWDPGTQTFLSRCAQRLARQIEVHQTQCTLDDQAILYRRITDNLPVAILRFKRHANGSGQLLFLSPGGEKLWDIPPLGDLRDECVLFETIVPDDLPTVAASIEKSAAELSPWHCEWRVQTPAGQLKWLWGRGLPSPQGDGSTVWDTLVLDVTARRRAEEALAKAKRLESSATVAGGIAHDFNNILTGLFGHLSLARLALPEGHPALDLLLEAEGALQRATGLTRQLLTFARGGAPCREAASLAELVQDVVTFDLVGSTVQPVFKVAADLWPAAVDKDQIQQVFSNLTLNARQAMAGGGHLYVSLKNATRSCGEVPPLPPGRYLEATVRDEGPGIDPAHLERIFEPYFSTKATGNGLGLATAYAIVKSHGGHLGVQSTPGRGTSFVVHLPATSTPVPCPPPPPKPPPRRAPPPPPPARGEARTPPAK